MRRFIFGVGTLSLKRLVAANPWGRSAAAQLHGLRPSDLATLATPSPAANLLALARERRGFQETLSAQGTAAWNRWAEVMRTLRPAEPNKVSEANLLWHAFAFADFSDSQFSTNLDWAGRRFPSGLCLSRSRFDGYTYLSVIEVPGDLIIETATFKRDCWLDQVAVEGTASLRGTTWLGRLEGRTNRYAGALDGRATRFGRDCWFVGSTIGGATDFTGAHFASDSGFGNCCFSREALFDNVAFEDTVGMEDCVFAGPVSFRATRFAKRLFMNRASFVEEPIIDRAEFAIAPSLTGARFPAEATSASSSPLRAVSVQH